MVPLLYIDKFLFVLPYKYLLLFVLYICFLWVLSMTLTQFVSACSSLPLGVDSYRGRSEVDLRTHARLQLLEVLHGRRLIRNQVEARRRIFGELNPAIGEPVVEPMGGDAEPPGELGDSQTPSHVARMRLMPLLHEAVLEPDRTDGTRQ